MRDRVIWLILLLVGMAVYVGMAYLGTLFTDLTIWQILIAFLVFDRIAQKVDKELEEEKGDA